MTYHYDSSRRKSSETVTMIDRILVARDNYPHVRVIASGLIQRQKGRSSHFPDMQRNMQRVKEMEIFSVKSMMYGGQ